MIQTLHFSCEGESHKSNKKACQDYSLTFNEVGLTVAIVCDGHGGERYFRSDVGAKLAAEVTLDSVKSFVNSIREDFFKDKQYTAIGPTNTIEDAELLSDIDVAFRRLFSSIIYKWNEYIDEHSKANALTEWEKNNVSQKYIDEYLCASSYEKYYGCTLMTYVQTANYWFAFHIGDGKCISFQDNPVWKEPIPWDERCFLNKTTSLCDTEAIEEFRYCYQGNGVFPTAIILGSDGMDDSFGETENLVNFYVQILKMLINKGKEATEESIVKELPELSKIGSKDDMSVAIVYDTEKLLKEINHFIQFQIKLVEDNIRQIDERINMLSNKLESENLESSEEKEKIEKEYSKKELEKANESRRNLLMRHDALCQQLKEEESLPYKNDLDEEKK